MTFRIAPALAALGVAAGLPVAAAGPTANTTAAVIAAGPTLAAAQAPQDDGGDAAPARRTRAAPPTWRYGVDDLLVEGGHLPDAPEGDWVGSLRASAFVQWQPDRTWEGRAGARVYGDTQQGGAADYTRWSADYTDTFVRWRGDGTRLTLGAQTVIWGRVDGVPLADRVSRADLTRFLLDDLPQRRRAQLAARWEQTWNELKLDAMVLPWFRGAELPDIHSVWSPINRTTGEIAGIAPSDALAAFVRNASIDDGNATGGSGGGAARLTRTGESFDVGLTLARTRQSLPYYAFDAAALRLTEVHPFQNFAGVDAEWVWSDITWRTELGYTTDVPVTRPDTTMAMAKALEWVGALEFFPGGQDTRVNLQLVARDVRIDGPILELERYVGVNGEVETSFAQERWKASLRFAGGLNVNDLYLGPKLSFVGWEPHEIYLAGHYFAGEARTLGGFHRDHGLIALGWRTRF